MVYRKKDLSELELRESSGKSASDAVEIFIALFSLLALADFHKTESGKIADFLDSETLTLQFTTIGRFGISLADSCFGDIQECLAGYRQLMEERESSNNQKSNTEVRNG